MEATIGIETKNGNYLEIDVDFEIELYDDDYDPQYSSNVGYCDIINEMKIGKHELDEAKMIQENIDKIYNAINRYLEDWEEEPYIPTGL